MTGVNFVTGELGANGWNCCVNWCPSHARGRARQSDQCRDSETTLRDVVPAARAMGLQIQVLNAGTSGEIDAGFAIVRDRPDGLFVGGDALFTGRRVQLTTLAARHAMPAIYRRATLPKSAG